MTLHPYIVTLRSLDGCDDNTAVLVIAKTGRAARAPGMQGLGSIYNEVMFTDIRVWRGGNHLLRLADREKLARGEEHVIDDPAWLCPSCECWTGVPAGDRCSHCEGEDS